MKKFYILVSLFILASCSEGPSEYGLFGNTVDMACVNCDLDEKPVQTTYQSKKETEIWRQEDEVNKKPQPVEIIEEEEVITYKSYPKEPEERYYERSERVETKMQSRNRAGDTYFIINDDGQRQGFDCSRPNNLNCGGLKVKHPKQDCECTKQDPKGSPCYEKMQMQSQPQPVQKPNCPRSEGQKCPSKKCCNVSVPVASPLDQIELSSDQELQNKEIAKIRKQEQQKFKSVWASKPVSNEINGLNERQTVDEQIVYALSYLSNSQKPVCISDPNLGFAKDAYKRILQTSETCCRTYMANIMRDMYGKDATYKFLTDDYNFYKAGELCMFYSDADIQNIFSEKETWDLVKHARNQCTCLNSNLLSRDIKTLKVVLDHKNLNKGSVAYKMKDEFGEFAYRNLTQDLNNLSDKLKSCPK